MNVGSEQEHQARYLFVKKQWGGHTSKPEIKQQLRKLWHCRSLRGKALVWLGCDKEW
jgi:hypothetical protein